jgi:hypothetical protein
MRDDGGDHQNGGCHNCWVAGRKTINLDIVLVSIKLHTIGTPETT